MLSSVDSSALTWRHLLPVKQRSTLVASWMSPLGIGTFRMSCDLGNGNPWNRGNDSGRSRQTEKASEFPVVESGETLTCLQGDCGLGCGKDPRNSTGKRGKS